MPRIHLYSILCIHRWGEPERALHGWWDWCWDAVYVVRPPPGGSETSVKISTLYNHVHDTPSIVSWGAADRQLPNDIRYLHVQVDGSFRLTRRGALFLNAMHTQTCSWRFRSSRAPSRLRNAPNQEGKPWCREGRREIRSSRKKEWRLRHRHECYGISYRARRVKSACQ